MKKNLSLRLEEKDYILLDEQSKILGVTKNEYIRILLRKNLALDIKELNENLKNIYRVKVGIGNNLNQIARKYNIKSVENFREIEKELDDLWQSLRR